MGTVKDRLADDDAADNAAYFNDMARHYQALAMAAEHEAQSDLFATIAADYGELAAEATACMPRTATATVPAEPASFARWIHWVGRWRRPVTPLNAPLVTAPLSAPLPLPAVPTAAE